MAVISHKFKFIFIKTTKTAGTSIEVCLSKICDDKDIFSPIHPAEEGHQPRNYKDPCGDFYNHMSAKEIKGVVGEAIFNDYFKFCVERDPLEKCISHYYMLQNANHIQDQDRVKCWDEYIERGNFPVDIEKYSVNNRMIVDRILKYESLDFELREVFNKIGVGWIGLNSWAKANYRPRGLTEIKINEKQLSVIANAFRETIELTGYYKDYLRFI